MKNLRSFLLRRSVALSAGLRIICALGIALPSLAPAATVFNETFTGATYIGTTGSAGTGVTQGAATWYSTNTNVAGGPGQLATDNNAPLSGNVLALSGFSNNSLAIAGFNTVSLGLGDFIQVSLNYRSTTGTSGRTFLGFYNDGGTPVTADYWGNVAAGTELINDKGYNFSKLLANSTADLTLYSETISVLKTVQFQQNNGQLLQTSASGFLGNDTMPHTISFKLTRELTGNLTLTGGYDGVLTSFSVASGSVLTTSFNELVIGGYGSASNFDNILVTTGVIPEPAPVAGLLGGLVLLGVIWHRSRRVSA